MSAGGQPAQGRFRRACALSELPADGALGVEVDGTPVCMVRTGSEIFALHDVCSHEEVPLSEGEVYDHTVECWLHGSCFDLRTGKPTGPPATKPVTTYEVKIDGDDLFVAL
jgi:3-phenylpropionate/trans-cinnamate dioxygenase ferredoxin component